MLLKLQPSPLCDAVNVQESEVKTVKPESYEACARREADAHFWHSAKGANKVDFLSRGADVFSILFLSCALFCNCV